MSVRLCSDGDDEAGDGPWVHLVVLLGRLLDLLSALLKLLLQLGDLQGLLLN